MLTNIVLPSLPYLIPFLLFVYLGTTYWRLGHVPGPKLAAFSDLWRVRIVWRGRAEMTYLELHKQYGDVVRVGPNCVSVCRPNVIQSIYGIGNGFIKASRDPDFNIV